MISLWLSVLLSFYAYRALSFSYGIFALSTQWAMWREEIEFAIVHNGRSSDLPRIWLQLKQSRESTRESREWLQGDKTVGCRKVIPRIYSE